jgi:hypothetical protein
MSDEASTKAERRDAKRRAARSRIARHGGSLAAIYANAVLKRARGQRRSKRKK